MSSAARKPPQVPRTVEEFLVWPGDGTDRKFELVDGELRAMAPTSPTHSIIQANLAFHIGNHLRLHSLPCVVGTEVGAMPRVSGDINAWIPDLAVSCAKAPDADQLMADPVLLIEVLSSGNRAQTMGKIHGYATIPSVREIILIESTKMEAKIATRQADGNWPAKLQTIKSNASLIITSIDLTLTFADIYRGTKLAT